MRVSKSTATAAHIHRQLPPKEWSQQKRHHTQKIGGVVDPYLERRSNQKKDPVMDFLFEYYAFRPSKLRSWSPGFGTLLVDGATHNWRFEEMCSEDNHCFLDLAQFPRERISSLRWILEVLQNSANKRPSFGCFGMHEWAMVYKADRIRHQHIPLRMDKDKLAEFVESRPLVCTHFDAFRFFTDEAKPKNKFALNREKFSQMEQPGCLHTNMDLYKWAFKMFPWISSNTIRQAFELAVETRIVDMKASPYDLRKRGLEPIKIETEKGRLAYVEQQRSIFERSQPIRRQLIKEYRQLLNALGDESPPT
ncbi:3-methyladenine DNA glycosylase [Fodinibius sediminis]|uniref:3-methyladenine DNA glycosylase n=1 Tax=Fodinibius sediminis TaxID=1214077 RepID=A0A521F4N8_9BACT|nr:3-methyladenine DNA glycosylase [Fodinibius sediminis]SMO91123.1 hypothetical protein SAMN06265218_12320 [Fodinibius sediminis]